MTNPTNSFEGGTSGSAITTGNSGGASGNAFTFVQTGTGVTIAYDNTQAAHGLLSAKIATTGTASPAYCQWNAATIGSSADCYLRGYYYFTANPASTVQLMSAGGTGGGALSVYLNSSGKLVITYGTGATTYVTFTAAIPLNTWFRVEAFVIISATGQVSGTLFPGDSITPTETHTSGSLNTGTAPLTNAQFGLINTLASAGPYWVDDIGASIAGPLGPVVPAAELEGSEELILGLA